MDEQQPSAGFGVTGKQPESEFEVRTLEEGSVLELADGRFARVADNPHDGVWLVCDILDAQGGEVGQTEPVMCYDLVGLVRRGPADE
jgi:hypothetical protein